VTADPSYSVDGLLLHSGYVCAWGWFFRDDSPVVSLCMILETRGTAVRVDGRYGVPRPDLAAIGHHAGRVASSGFVVFGRAPAGRPERVFLEATLARGDTCRVEVALTAIGGATGHPRDFLRGLGAPSLLSRLRRRYRWSRVLLGYIAQPPVSRFLRTRRRGLARFRAEAPSVHPLSTDALLDLLRSARAQPLSLMVDHTLGGGTNLYREQRILQQTNAGGAVILLSYDFHRLRYFLGYVTRERRESFETDSLAALVILVAAVTVDEILLNNVGSFPDPLMIADLTVRLTRLTQARLTVAVHDFLSVCPSWSLLNDEGRFCAVPSIARCRRCLPNIGGEVRAIAGCDDIDRWRAVWGDCLREATSVLCFSGSSRDLVARAYPNLGQDKFVVQPHVVDYLERHALPSNLHRPLHIGVVGEITKAKGAAIVSEMARLIRQQHLPAEITVIGRLEGGRESGALRILGPYRRPELPHLIKQCGANVFLLPSIWPETFSYVAEELMRLGVPLAVFNLGAPAERVAQYEHGLVLDRVEATHALKELLAFHADLRARRA